VGAKLDDEALRAYFSFPLEYKPPVIQPEDADEGGGGRGSGRFGAAGKKRRPGFFSQSQDWMDRLTLTGGLGGPKCAVIREFGPPSTDPERMNACLPAHKA